MNAAYQRERVVGPGGLAGRQVMTDFTPQSERDGLTAAYVCPRGHRHYEGSAFCTVCGAGPVLEALPAARRLRWKVGDFVGRWINLRLGTWIEGTNADS